MLQYLYSSTSIAKHVHTASDNFFSAVGIFLYYVVICLYLYGDLAIYAVAIPKSMTKAVW